MGDYLQWATAEARLIGGYSLDITPTRLLHQYWCLSKLGDQSPISGNQWSPSPQSSNKDLTHFNLVCTMLFHPITLMSPISNSYSHVHNLCIQFQQMVDAFTAETCCVWFIIYRVPHPLFSCRLCSKVVMYSTDTIGHISTAKWHATCPLSCGLYNLNKYNTKAGN